MTKGLATVGIQQVNLPFLMLQRLVNDFMPVLEKKAMGCTGCMCVQKLELLTMK